jgi:hypothetical protein
MAEMRRNTRTTKSFTQWQIIAFSHDFLSRLSRPLLWLLIIGLLSAIGVVDYFTGTDVSVGFFYLPPIAIAAW